VETIMAESRDPQELEQVWQAWSDRDSVLRAAV
jgi:hypothetical protein